MLKYVLWGFLGIVAVALVVSAVHLYKVQQKNKREMAAYAGQQKFVHNDLGKVLVVYYSLSGHTQEIAKDIAKMTGGDLYEIKTAAPVKASPLFYWQVRQQLKNKKYPALAPGMPDLGKYDVIFVGSPVWWYTVSTPVLSFLQQADFGGKKVVPFSTEGSNYGSFFKDFAENARNAVVLSGQSFNNLPQGYELEVNNKIAEWINSLQ